MTQPTARLVPRTVRLEFLEDRRLLSVQRLGEISSRRPSYTQSQDALYFRAEDAEHGAEVWRSTATGIELFADLLPGPESSHATNLHWIGNTIFATGLNTDDATVQYVSDGTQEGTHEVGFTSRAFVSSGVFQGHLITVLTGSDDNNVLVKIGVDGSVEQLATLGSQRLVRRLVATDSYLYFHLGTSENGLNSAVWRTDGTADGTEMIFERAIQPWHQYSLGTAYAYIRDNQLVGVPDEGSSWRIQDVQPQRTDAVERAVLGDHVYFGAHSEPAGYELWRTDGTEAGTGLFLDLLPGPESSRPASFTVVGDRLFLQARNESGAGVQWSTDGTPEGTIQEEVLLPTTWSNRELAEDRVLASTSDGYWLTEADGTRRRIEWDGNGSFVGSAGDHFFFVAQEENGAWLSAYDIGDFVTADANRDGEVGFQDFLTLSENFGRDDAGRAEGDLDGDGAVTLDDFAILAAQFGCARR